jgi:hypothetical protein
MNLTDLTSRDIKQIARLIERKESLAEQIEDINRDLAGVGSVSSKGDGGALVAKRGPAPRARIVKKQPAGKTAARSGGRKEQIIEALKEAGKEGVHVKDIASRIGISKGSVNVWFYTTAKKIPNIEQTGPGKFRWSNGR